MKNYKCRNFEGKLFMRKSLRTVPANFNSLGEYCIFPDSIASLRLRNMHRDFREELYSEF